LILLNGPKGRRGLAASIVREALAAYIAGRPAADLPSFTGAFDSGHADTAERHDELIFRNLAPHGGTVQARTKRGRRRRTTRTRRG
jgi:hypothetical protein